MKRIENKAVELLHKYGYFEFPVAIDKVAESMGLMIVYHSFGRRGDISGSFIQDNNQSVIGVNDTNSKVRQRFTIAHELGHFALRHLETNNMMLDKKVLYRDGLSEQGTDKSEKEANAFAAAILMPEKLIRKAIFDYHKLEDHDLDIVEYLAKEFHVSTQAMAFRLQKLKVLDNLYFL